MVEQGQIAQEEVSTWSDESLDKVIHCLANKFSIQCREWAEKEFISTSIGNIDDKEHTLALITNQVFKGIHGIKTSGRISDGQMLIEYTCPIGLVFAVVPLTNPIPQFTVQDHAVYQDSECAYIELP